MSLVLYLAVLIVSVSGVIFSLDWLAAPAPQYRPPLQVAVNHSPPPPRHLGSDAATRPLPPANPAPVAVKSPPVNEAAVKPAAPAKTEVQVQPAAPSAEANANPQPPAAPAVQPDAAPPAIAAAEPVPKCDVQACQAAYISFRATDCTYQPSFGGRRLCEKGTPPQASPSPDPNAQASAAPPSCNVQACQQAYFTFTAADCTYQPSNGPRRVCTK